MKRRQAAPVSPTRKPEGMTLEQWQLALRRQVGRDQKFHLKNLGGDEIFSEFSVTNPQSGRSYRVAVRGPNPGDNFCACPDFAVNTLGTCKHIEFALGKLERKPGGKARLASGFHPPYSEVYLRYGPKREVAFRAGASCPTALKRLAAGHFDPSGILKPDAYARFGTFLKKASGPGHELRCYEDTIAFVAQVRDRARREALIAKAFPQGVESPAWKDLLKVPLYSYQREGALFAAKAGRSLIADDMGLGKTVQAIAAIEILRRTVGLERVLIVCPTSLKHQWKQEIEKFSDRTAMVIEGLSPARATRYLAEGFYKIVNYDVIHRDLEAIHHWAPDLVILDEAQRIKNWKTRTAQAVKRLLSEHAIVLTGTPLENRLEELHSIVEFVDRFRLGPSFRFLEAHQILDDHGKVEGYRNLSRISETLKPILIRRTKQEVLKQLPERLEKTLFLPMTPEQKCHHEENAELVARIVAKWRRFGFLSEGDQRRLMIFLQNMRMSCNSTYLLDDETDHGTKADEVSTLLAEMLENPETKAVVFSQWLKTHELLRRRIVKRKWDFVLFHGGVPGKKRKDLVQRFLEDPRCRLFLSTDAGGVGLNLQHASAVVNMDMPWNPAVLEQRIGRVHRLGQHRPVRVLNLVAEGTIEHGMLSLLAFKKSLFAGVLDGGKDEVFLGGSRLKRFMETVEQVSNAVPQEQASENGDATPAERTAGGNGGPVRQATPALRPAVAGAPSPQPAWADLASAGLSFLGKLGEALAGSGGTQTSAGAGPLASLVQKDERTGQSYLMLPAPEPETLRKFTDLLAALTSALSGPAPAQAAPSVPAVSPASPRPLRTRSAGAGQPR